MTEANPPRLKQDRWLHLLYESIKDYAIILLDPAGRVAAWNPAAERLLGFTEEEILGQPILRIFTPEDVSAGIPQWELQEARRESRATDDRWQMRKDGSRFWASGVVTPLFDEQGNLEGFAKILRDLTDFKRLQDELAEANRRKDRFLAILAHELRNPLGAISSAATLLEHLDPYDAAFQETCQILNRQIRHIVTLVDELSDLSRIARGKFELNRQRVSLDSLLEHAVESVQPLIEERGHRFQLENRAGGLQLDVDPVRIQQVVANVLANAAKYTEPGGQIWLSALQAAAEVVITIRDTGIGIDPDTLPHVFDLFSQATDSHQVYPGGLGIGLSLAKQLVELHGGLISAYSEGRGRGSEFQIRLPVA